MTFIAESYAVMTAAEIVAAEAAAAAAAQAAATAAAQQAAQAALAPALTEAAATALPEVAGSVLPEAAGSILEAAPGVVPPPATPLPPAGLEQIGQAAVPPPTTPLPPATPTPPAGIEQVGQSGIQTASGPATSDVASFQNDQAIIDMIKNYQGGPQPELSPEVLQVTGNVPAPSVVPGAQTTAADITAQANAMQLQPPSTTGFSGSGNPFLDAFDSVTKYMGENKFQTATLATTGLGYMGAFKPPGTPMPEKRQYKGQYSLSPNFRATSPEPNIYQEKRYDYAVGGVAGMQNSYDDENGSDMARGGIASSGGYANGGQINLQGTVNLDQNSMGDSKMNPAGGLSNQIFPGGPGGIGMAPRFNGPMTGGPGMGPQGQMNHMYQPPMSQISPGGPGGIGMQPQLAVMPRNYEPLQAMASGGIASFAKGTPREKDPEADFARYYALMEGQAPEQPPAPSYVGRVGIAYDDDQDTRYQDPLTAALIRQGKASKRAGIPAGPVIPRPKPLGTINLAPAGTQQAASGGIMGYNLGGYADGGNPRLLKGPGDGMSDNIPAVIGSRQPARLADGEFVVPADVVSHLGNGSTDAGAKKLHQMMDKIRMARTGKKKQAPAVKPKKYMPK